MIQSYSTSFRGATQSGVNQKALSRFEPRYEELSDHEVTSETVEMFENLPFDEGE